MNTYTYTVRLPKDLHEALVRQAEAEDRPLSRVVRRALRQYVALTSETGEGGVTGKGAHPSLVSVDRDGAA